MEWWWVWIEVAGTLDTFSFYNVLRPMLLAGYVHPGARRHLLVLKKKLTKVSFPCFSLLRNPVAPLPACDGSSSDADGGMCCVSVVVSTVSPDVGVFAFVFALCTHSSSGSDGGAVGREAMPSVWRRCRRSGGGAVGLGAVPSVWRRCRRSGGGPVGLEAVPSV